MKKTILLALSVLAINVHAGQSDQLDKDSTDIAGMVGPQQVLIAHAQTTGGSYTAPQKIVDKSSWPATTNASCNSYQGQYGIAFGATGTFQITKEANPNNANYGKVLSYDSSTCTGTNGVWNWQGWTGPHGATCNYATTGQGKTCAPVGAFCSFADDQTKKVGSYMCQ